MESDPMRSRDAGRDIGAVDVQHVGYWDLVDIALACSDAGIVLRREVARERLLRTGSVSGGSADLPATVEDEPAFGVR
jgi:hypothetical protein